GDVGNPFANFETEPISNDPNADPNDNPNTKLRTTDFPGHSVIWRNVANGAAPPVPPPNMPSDATIIAPTDYPTFVTTTNQPHANVPDWFGGTLQIEHLAAFDPFFFLFHANYDRLFALWQLQDGHAERLDGNTLFGPWLTDPEHLTALTSPMVPWDGS